MKIIFLIFTLITFNLLAKSKGIDSYSEPVSGIFRGPRPINQNDYNLLEKLNLKNVVNLQGKDLYNKLYPIIKIHEPGENKKTILKEKEALQSVGIAFYHLPLSSLETMTDEDDKKIDDLLAFMNNEENRPLYVHCEHGKDRTGLIIALYKVKYLNMPIDLAYGEWVKEGHSKKSQIFTGKLDNYFFKKVKELNK